MPNPIAAISGNGDETQTLVVIFLRGAADGLTLVPPIQDDNYFRSRPRIGVAPTPYRWTECLPCNAPQAAQAPLGRRSSGHRSRRGIGG